MTMKTKIYLLLYLLAIPAIGFATSTWVISSFNTNVRTVFKTERPDLSEQQINAITADGICSQPDLSGDEFCSQVGSVYIFKSVSLWAGIGGIFLLTTIWLAGMVARNDRNTLVTLFKPGLYMTLLGTCALIIAYAGILVATIYYGETMLVNRIHIGIIIAISLGALVGVLAVGKGIFTFFKKTEINSIGVLVSPTDAPALWKLVREVANTVETEPPVNLILSMDGSFYVTETSVTSLNGKSSGRSLNISIPFLRLLKKEEFKSILAHEFGHFKGDDTKYGLHFSPIYRSAGTALYNLTYSTDNGAGQIALLPAIAILGYFFESFSSAESEISRQRELEADLIASNATSSRDFAIALAKACTYSEVYNSLCSELPNKVRSNEELGNVSLDGYAICNELSSSISKEQISGASVSHPLDSHPTLIRRLESIGVELDTVYEETKRLPGLNETFGDEYDLVSLENRLMADLGSYIAQKIQAA